MCLPDSRERAKLQLCSFLPSRTENPGCIRIIITASRGSSSLTAGSHCRPTWREPPRTPSHPSILLGSCCGTLASAAARHLPTPSPAPRHPPGAPGWLSSEARMLFTSSLRSWARGGLGGQGSCGAGEVRWRVCRKRRSSGRGRQRTEAAAEPEPGSARWRFPL